MIELLALAIALAAGSNYAQFQWRTQLTEPYLSHHQRLITEVQIGIDGAELSKRRGKGELIIRVQFTDGNGRAYEGHENIDLRNIREGMGHADVTYSQAVFICPGDYQVSTTIEAPATQERSVHKQRLHVATLKNDPLPEAWSSLPPVEFIAAAERPDSWYWPAIRGKLNLPLHMAHTQTVEAVVNLTPSEWALGSYSVQDRNLGMLLPSLKALVQMRGSGLEVNVTLLDLSSHTVVFRQENVRELDWFGARKALGEVKPAVVTIGSLGDRQRSAAFFTSQIARVIAGRGQKPAVVIVLTMLMLFEPEQQLLPIAAPAGGATPKIVYIRYHADRIFDRPGPNRADDQLAPTLRPLKPEVFDVHGAEDFRRVLARALREIGNL